MNKKIKIFIGIVALTLVFIGFQNFGFHDEADVSKARKGQGQKKAQK